MKHKTCSFWGFAVSQTTKPKAKSVDSTKDDTKNLKQMLEIDAKNHFHNPLHIRGGFMCKKYSKLTNRIQNRGRKVVYELYRDLV